MSLENLWHLVDVVVGNRLHCANWRDLNDPLEGYYELLFKGSDMDSKRKLELHLEGNRDKWRIASFSKDPGHFLLWSHYANGHKGVALELEFDEDDPQLSEVIYSPFSYIFDERTDISLYYPGVFAGKSEEWEYEQEYRLIADEEFVHLTKPCRRILLGPHVDAVQKELLRKVLPNEVELVPMFINMSTSRVEQRST